MRLVLSQLAVKLSPRLLVNKQRKGVSVSEEASHQPGAEPVASSNADGTLDAILRKLEETAQPGKNNRSAKRYSIAIPVPVVPIDENGTPIDRSFTALSRDISTSGICLQHTRATNAKKLIVVLSIPGTKPASLIVEVVRCRAIGRFYEIAAKFTSRVTENSEVRANDLPTS